MINRHSALEMARRQFIEPADEFGPLPFWFWNDRLESEELVRQIRDFHDKGVSGFVLHPRIGLDSSIPYLSDAYMDLVETAVAEAARYGMQVILYDEAMYPSGSAMGKVVARDRRFASRGLKQIVLDCGAGGVFDIPLEEEEVLVSAQAVRLDNAGRPDLATVQVLAASGGQVAFTPPEPGEWSLLLFIETYSGGKIRGVYYGQDDGEPAAPRAADLLNPQATAAFIDITHEAYYARLRQYFGNTVIAMFTDEPSMLGRGHQRGLKAWTSSFLSHAESFGFREPHLAALWLPDEDETAASHRADYRKAIHARLAESFYKPLSEWCGQRGIALTGHPAESDEIGLLDYFQLPGQDIVWRYIEPNSPTSISGRHSTMGKCSSDSARHRGRRRNLNECFGACFKDNIGWHFSGDDMKWYMDWLFVRGVNMLVPHAFYYSIAGKRKDERPPDVGPNSIWWPHYNRISAYMKRLSWLMTDSVNTARTAILCTEDRLPFLSAGPLYEQQIEFNYLEESLLVSDCTFRDGAAHIGQQRYTAIVVERPERFAADTLRRLADFALVGGRVIVSGDLTGAMPSGLDAFAETVAASELPAALERVIPRSAAMQPSGPDIRVSAVVKDGLLYYLFVNEGEQPYNGSAELPVYGYVEKWDAWQGTTAAQAILLSEAGQQSHAGEKSSMRVPLSLERRSSIVFCIDPSSPPQTECDATAVQPTSLRTIHLNDGWTTRVTAQSLPVPDGRDDSVSAAREEIPAPAAIGCWTGTQGLEHFSGTIEYRISFRLEAEECGNNRTILLDLGDVAELAEVELNGIPQGFRMWKPYRYASLAADARPGENSLLVRVTNSLANAYDQASLPSGLLGPVTVEIAAV